MSSLVRRIYPYSIHFLPSLYTGNPSIAGTASSGNGILFVSAANVPVFCNANASATIR